MARGEYLFVYGTLMKRAGGPAIAEMKRYARYIGEAKVRGALYMAMGYPALKEDSGESQVSGELWRISDAASLFKALDRYEGAAYRRVVREVEGPEGKLKAWLYLYLPPVSPKSRIVSGDFAKLRRGRRS
ncbi:gamma-glutamylcyclotransferase family protein [Hydrogenimonas sp.]